jgi:rare lipoprotein A (peptidoglycan hydrolase)
MMLLRFVVVLSTLVLVSCQTPAYQEQGWASYIANNYAGRLTSSGQVYDPRYYTAAHNTLPFGTEVTVKNLYNGRSVKAIVTDRFPYYPGRVINLSWAAANYIAMPQMQLAQVQVKAYKIPQANYAVQPSYPQNQGYAQQQVYRQQQTYSQPVYSQPQQQMYQPQPAAQQPYYPPTQQQAAAPKYSAPTYPTQPTPAQAPVQQSKPSFFKRLGGNGTPAAPSYQGGSGPPPGLNTF